MAGSIESLRAALADRYTLIREIGSGGMATVYLAEDLRHRRKVAVKVLRPDLAATLGADRFSREIEIAAQLQHPHILPLLDSGEAAGALYYVMPYVAGESLRQRLGAGAELPVAEVVRILCEVADALANAHAHGVVHRDVKPENIMLSGRHALVTDFGVAKAVSEAKESSQLTSVGIALGTPAYMAPEQAAADPAVDHRADLYALGVVGYELLTGHLPCRGASAQETLAAHLTQEPVPVERLRPAVPPALAAVIMRCLAKRPADRFQSAEEIVTRLETINTPSGGMAPTTALGAGVRRSRVPLLAALAGAAVALAGVAVLALRHREPPVLALGRATQITFDQGLELDPALSPDGKLIAYVSGPAERMRLWVRQIGGGQPIRIGPDTGASQRAPHWSPDGTRLVYGAGNTVLVSPALGGQPRVLVAGVARGSAASSPAWSPDGKLLAYASNDSIFFADPVSGATRLRLAASGAAPHSFAWSPDGRRLAFVSGNREFAYGTLLLGNIGPSSIWTMPVEGGAPKALTDTVGLNVSPVWSGNDAVLLVSDRNGPRDVYQVGVRADGGPEGSPVRLTNGLGAHSISLSGDGKRLAYSVWTIRSNIWRAPIPATGSGSDSAAERVTVGNQNIEGLSLSPDGRWLYFDSNRDGNQDLFRVALSGGEPEQLTTNPRDDFYPNVSPDGRFVAFHSVRENGRRAIVVIPSGGGPEQIVHAGSGEDRLATWSHDGRRIAFAVTEASPAENGTYVVERGADGTWGKPRRVFDDALGAYWLPGDSALLLVPTPYARRFGPGERVLRTVPVAGGPMVELPLAMDSMGSLWPVPLPGRAEIGIKGFTAAGLAGFWIAGPRGGAPRLAIRFDDPSRPSPRFEWASDGRMLYFTVGERESDIYVAEVATTARP